MIASVSAAAAVTAVAFSPRVQSDGRLRLAYGTEDGRIVLASLSIAERVGEVKTTEVQGELCPGKTVTSLQWRPGSKQAEGTEMLAVASEDGSVRILLI